MKIYIYWEDQKYFTSFEDVQDYYKQNYIVTTFSDFLWGTMMEKLSLISPKLSAKV